MTATAVPAKPAEGGASAGAPAKAGLVLGTLILVAAVANLPLAMANVALPSIGAYFDATQTQLDLVAVAYSLGLACSVLWLGALGDRYGRKMMALLGVTLAIPAALLSGFAPTIQVLIVATSLRWFCGGHGLSDHPLPDCGVVGGGACTHALDRVVGRHRRRDLGVRPDALRLDPGGHHLALGLPDRHTGGSGSDLHGAEVHPGAHQRREGVGGQPRRHPLGGAHRNVCPRAQLPAGRRLPEVRVGPVAHRGDRHGALRFTAAPRQESPV